MKRQCYGNIKAAKMYPVKDGPSDRRNKLVRDMKSLGFSFTRDGAEKLIVDIRKALDAGNDFVTLNGKRPNDWVSVTSMGKTP